MVEKKKKLFDIYVTIIAREQVHEINLLRKRERNRDLWNGIASLIEFVDLVLTATNLTTNTSAVTIDPDLQLRRVITYISALSSH